MFNLSMIVASITLSPFGMVSVCPGGQVLLTCERTSGSFLHWNVSVPHLTTRETTVANQGTFRSVDIRLTGFLSATFTITHTSVNPLTSQMIVSNVTAEINGTTIYCSEDGNENGAPMVILIIINEGILNFVIDVLIINCYSFLIFSFTGTLPLAYISLQILATLRFHACIVTNLVLIVIKVCMFTKCGMIN